MDDYERLIRRFPLERIRDDEHLAQAKEVANDCYDERYVLALRDLIMAYEHRKWDYPESVASTLEVLLMDKGVTLTEFSREIDIGFKTIIDILMSRHTPTDDEAEKLASYFGHPVDVFTE